jgi:hypothetical protein
MKTDGNPVSFFHPKRTQIEVMKRKKHAYHGPVFLSAMVSMKSATGRSKPNGICEHLIRNNGEGFFLKCRDISPLLQWDEGWGITCNPATII